MNNKPIYRSAPDAPGLCWWGNSKVTLEHALKLIDEQIYVERVMQDDADYLAKLFWWQDEIKERLKKAA